MDTEMTRYESFAEVTEDFYCSAVDVLKILVLRLHDYHTEHFKKKIGNTTYRVRVHFPQNTKRTFTDSVNTLIMNECTSKKK